LTVIEIVFWLTCFCGLIWAAAVFALAFGMARLRHSHSYAKPTIAILIAARNEEECISDCLAAIEKQDYPENLREIVVINDNSDDSTADIARSFRDKIPGLRIIDAGELPEGIAPKKNALIAGIKATSSDIILTTDTDCQPPPGWISGIATCFEQDVDAVVGYSPLTGRGLIGALARFDGFISAIISAGTTGLGYPGSSVGRNFAYRRQAWLDAGGFGSDAAAASGDDDLLLQRIASRGKKVVFATDPNSFVPARGKEKFPEWWRMKRRHYSAARRYKPGLVIAGTLLYLFNPALVIMTIMAAAGHIDPIVAVGVWGAKISADGLALSRGSRLFHHQGWVFPWLIGEILSPVIFTILLPVSMVGRINWKGRKLDG